MMRIYFDNAATTPLDAEVLDAMMPFLKEKFGNPSSIYSYGRETRLAIENARKTVSRILNVNPSEIFFTSGGTESSNTAILASVNNLGCKRIITSPIEHHAVLHTVEYIQKRGLASVHYVSLTPNGDVDLSSLEQLLGSSAEKTLVSLMHANNEIGNMIDLQQVGEICKKYQAIFHSDTVQTIGHFPFDLHKTHVHFITGSGHKFHGPKGCGILYINEDIRIEPFIHGGGQERNMRAGTENVYGIVGFARALEMATEDYEKDRNHIQGIKHYMMDELKKTFPTIQFNGNPSGNSLYTVLNVSFPLTEKSEMLFFNLDINNICVSGGSACSSGANMGSHVINNISQGADMVAVRFSFSKLNSKNEVDQVVAKLKEII